jgi:hypothetical protein
VLTTRRRDCADRELLRGVDVVREGFESLKEVYYYRMGAQGARGRVGVLPQKHGMAQRLLFWVYRNTWKKVLFPDESVIWQGTAKSALRRLLLQQRYDVVVTVSLPFSSHVVGRAVLRNLPADRRPIWLADMGDPFGVQRASLNNKWLYDTWNRRLERAILTSADAVAVTTQETKDAFEAAYGAGAVARAWVIGPLLHPMPSPSLPASPLPDDKKTVFAYFGSLYMCVRTPDALLRLLTATLERHPDLRERVELRFYGDIFPEFYDALYRAPCVRLMGLYSREAARVAMQEADVLLSIGNQEGLQLPSKAVDYMAARKPIFHLSYVENDPFVRFFEGLDVLMEVFVGAEGTASEKGVDAFAAWIKKTPIVAESTQWVSAMTGFRVESIAAQYEQAIREIKAKTD